MEIPKYTITNLILNYIVKYELAIQAIKQTVIPSPLLSEEREKIRAEEIDKLGELIAYPIGYSKALTVQRGQVTPSYKNKLRIFTNFKNTQDFIDTYTAKSKLKPSIELSSHLNKLAMKGLVDDWDLAKLKTFSEKPNEIYDTWFKMRDYYPHIDSASHFNEIFEWIKDGKDSNHKLIKFAALTYEFIDKAPYFVGNQITAILTLEILAKQYGYNPDNLLPFFKSINNISQDLLDAFKISKSKRDLTTFIEAFLYAISLTAIDVSRELKDTYTKKVKKQGALEISLNPRQIKVMDYITLNHKITRSKYTKMMGVSFMTSYRDLQEMVDKGYIKQKGQGRGTFYVLSKEQEDIVLEIE